MKRIPQYKKDDSKLVDFLATLWDSQGDGGKICGFFFNNPTGAFRDAVKNKMEILLKDNHIPCNKDIYSVSRGNVYRNGAYLRRVTDEEYADGAIKHQ